MKKLTQLLGFTLFLLFTISATSANKKSIETMALLPPTFMNEVLNYIQSTYPNEWLSGLVITNENIAVEISHPSNENTYLSVDIFPERVLIAVLEEANREIPFDLGGFHFDFTPDKMSEIQAFFNTHHQTGVAE